TSGIRLPAQRKGRQLQARGPPLGPCRQRRHCLAGQLTTCRLTQQRRSLLRGEPQVGGPQLAEPPAGPQPWQRQRRISPAGHHQVQARRQVLNQELKRRVHRLGLDQVVVVNDQQDLIPGRLGGQLVD